MKSRWLNWGTLSVLALLLMLGVPGLAFAQGSGGDGNGFSSLVANNPQPILIYTVFGNTVADQTASTLVVYNNGLAVSSNNGVGSDGSSTGNSSGNFQFAQITSDQVTQLMRDLRRSGAFRMGGGRSGQSTGDTPLTTITVFQNPDSSNGVTVARTFSFFSADTSRGRVNDVITNFMNNNFNGGSGGTGGTGGQ
jgi:hypothetical protein